MRGAGDGHQPNHHGRLLPIEVAAVSHAAIAAVLAREDLSTGERLVAWSLASFANREQHAWPGIPAAAARAGLSRSRYLEVRDELVRRGLFDVEQTGLGRGRASTVRLLFAQSGPWCEDEVNPELLEAVLGYSRARGPARLLLATLAALSDEAGLVEGVTTEELCRAAGLANSTYRRARAALLASGEVSVESDVGGRGRTCRWIVRRPAELGVPPTVERRRRIAPRRGARPLVAAVSDSLSAAEEMGPRLSGVSAEKGPILSGVSAEKGPIRGGVSDGRGPILSGVSRSNPANTPPQTPPETPPPNVRAGKEPQNSRTQEDPPTPLKGGSSASSLIVEETFLTAAGRTRRRYVPVDLDDVRRGLGLPSSTDRDDWRRMSEALRERLGDSQFEIWLEPIELIAVDHNGALVIAAPQDTTSWICERFGRLLSDCARQESREVRFANNVERAALGDHNDQHPTASEWGESTTPRRRYG